MAGVVRPPGRSPVPDVVFQIKAGTAFYQKPDYPVVTREGSLMERRRMPVKARRIVAVGVLTGVKQEFDDRKVPELRGERQGAMAELRRGRRN